MTSGNKNPITKIANTKFPIHDLIAQRWSVRAFSTRHVESSKLYSILEAARWAPSSRNEQPWRYIVFTEDNPDRINIARSVLLEINEYAKRAPILICAMSKINYTDNGIFNKFHIHDLGAANENMFLESFNQGLIMHEMGGFDRKKAKEVFNISDEYEIVVMIAIGYQGSNEVLPQRYKEIAHSPRVRKELSEIAFREEIGHGII